MVMSGLRKFDINKIKALEGCGYGLQDICAITGYDRLAVRDVIQTAEQRQKIANGLQLQRMRAARPRDRSPERHEEVLRANFPELYV